MSLPQISFFDREAQILERDLQTDCILYSASPQLITYFKNRWMSKWMFIENIYLEAWCFLQSVWSERKSKCHWPDGGVYGNAGRRHDVGLKTPLWHMRPVFSWASSPSTSHSCWNSNLLKIREEIKKIKNTILFQFKLDQEIMAIFRMASVKIRKKKLIPLAQNGKPSPPSL